MKKLIKKITSNLEAFFLRKSEGATLEKARADMARTTRTLIKFSRKTLNSNFLLKKRGIKTLMKLVKPPWVETTSSKNCSKVYVFEYRMIKEAKNILVKYIYTEFSGKKKN